MDLLEKQFEKLKVVHTAATIERRPDGTAVVTIPDFPLPAGWNSTTTAVHILVPVGYPHAKLDCFWTSPNLRLANNGMPANTGQNDAIGPGKLWFSYHPKHWNPNLDNLLTYAKVIKQRLVETR